MRGIQVQVANKKLALSFGKFRWNLSAMLLGLLAAQSRANGNFDFGTNLDPTSPSNRMNTNRGSAGSWRSNEEQLRCQDPDLPPNPTALHVASTGEEMEWEGAGRNVPTAGQDEHIEASHGFAPSANRKNHARLQIEGSAETPKHRRLKEEAQKLQRVQDKTSDTLHLIAKQNAKNMDLVKECENMLGSDQSSWTQEARRELQQLMQGMERERALLTSATSMDQKAKELLTTDPVFSQFLDPPPARR